MQSESIAGFYIWLFRGTPLLVQLIVFATGLYEIGIHLDLLTAALLALSLNEGAYMAEIVRAGIQSIDPGQMEAAKSLGMTYGLGMRRIILPQALRVILPPTGNEFNNMLKSSSLASVISHRRIVAAREQPEPPLLQDPGNLHHHLLLLSRHDHRLDLGPELAGDPPGRAQDSEKRRPASGAACAGNILSTRELHSIIDRGRMERSR